ncbi:MAG: uroporphyrinogen-III C-methyltransferase [Synergistaceae bacterium]|jgi:uroporphyrinogen III methyltransferase/synthase|nr:uroporphyrinogen-III C-methyltransferase [Synergistaceae bacterium]
MSDAIIGKVWLVGGGPGDPGLISVRGAEVLRYADVIVHDRLIGPGMSDYFPENAVLIDVGKRTGNHTAVQREIEEILIREASEGKRVARLKGGDPFIFGRGGEEILALASHGIPCEVVPGVTSALAVPAYAGIPATHRGTSCGVFVVTARRASGDDSKDRLDFDLMSAMRSETIVILMGACLIKEIAEGFLTAGRDPSTPAAIIENGTTARQRGLYAPLGKLAGRAKEEGMDAPCVIVIGDVAALRELMDLRASMPLAGLRIWLTQAKKNQCGTPGEPRLGRLLRDAGAETVNAPCIKIRPLDVELSAKKLRQFDWILFCSTSGVDNFWRQLRRNHLDIRAIGDARIAAVGNATGEALEEMGIRPDFVPDVHDGEEMARGIASLGAKKALLPRPAGRTPEWTGILLESGIGFEEIKIYETTESAPQSVNLCDEGDAVVFASASAVRAFTRAVDPGKDLEKIFAVCIGRPTALAASEAGYDAVTAIDADDDALFDAILAGHRAAK